MNATLAAPPLGVPARALVEWESLILGTERPTPCRLSLRWVSEDAEVRATAAQSCRQCHLIAECARYAQAANETVGVWAGVDRTPPAKPMGRPRKTNHEGCGMKPFDIDGFNRLYRKACGNRDVLRELQAVQRIKNHDERMRRVAQLVDEHGAPFSIAEST